MYAGRDSLKFLRARVKTHHTRTTRSSVFDHLLLLDHHWCPCRQHLSMLVPHLHVPHIEYSLFYFHCGLSICSFSASRGRRDHRREVGESKKLLQRCPIKLAVVLSNVMFPSKGKSRIASRTFLSQSIYTLAAVIFTQSSCAPLLFFSILTMLSADG